MEERKIEKEYWEKFKGRKISLLKQTYRPNRDFYYNGVVVDVLDDKIILDDIKLGEIPIPFKDVTIIGGGSP